MPMAIDEGLFCINHMVGEASCTMFTPWTLSFINSDEDLSWAGVSKWLEKNPGMKKVVQFNHPTNAVWQGFSLHQRNCLEANGIEVVDIDVPDETVDFGAVAVRALGEDPDGILFSNHPQGIARTIIELNRRGWTDNSKNLLFECAPTPELWEIGEGYLDGCYAWVFYNVENENPKWQELLTKFHEEFGDIEPSFCVYGGYDEVMLAKQCFEELKITGDPARLAEERLAIRDYMRNCTFDSIFGPVDIVDGIKMEPAWLFEVVDNAPANYEMCPMISH